jgi:hypothetical protein
MSKEQEKDKGGRPPIVLTEEQLEELKILSVTCTLDEIADYFGICKETFRQIKIRDEEVSSLYKKGLINAKKMVGNKIFKRAVIADDLTAQIYWMNHRGGWLKELKNEENEIKDKELKITVEIKEHENLDKFTPEQIKQLKDKGSL